MVPSKAQLVVTLSSYPTYRADGSRGCEVICSRRDRFELSTFKPRLTWCAHAPDAEQQLALSDKLLKRLLRSAMISYRRLPVTRETVSIAALMLSIIAYACNCTYCMQHSPSEASSLGPVLPSRSSDSFFQKALYRLPAKQ